MGVARGRLFWQPGNLPRHTAADRHEPAHYPVTALVKPQDKPMRKPWNAPLVIPDCPEGQVTGTPDYVGIGAQRCGTSWW
jgi:hypothetical protein